MTFANFDFEEYNDGYVNVSFTNDKITKESFNDFLNNWDNCDLSQNPYSFYILR